MSSSTILALLQGGLAHHKKGRTDLAEAQYRQILTEDPRHPDALHLLGCILQERGLYEESIQKITAAIRVRPNEFRFYNNLGEVFRKSGQLKKSIDAYQQAIKIYPEYPEAFNNLGIAYKDLRRFDEAIECFAKATTLYPNFVNAYHNCPVRSRIVSTG